MPPSLNEVLVGLGLTIRPAGHQKKAILRGEDPIFIGTAGEVWSWLDSFRDEPALSLVASLSQGVPGGWVASSREGSGVWTFHHSGGISTRCSGDFLDSMTEREAQMVVSAMANAHATGWRCEIAITFRMDQDGWSFSWTPT